MADWRTIDGRELTVGEMETLHIWNCLLAMKRCCEDDPEALFRRYGVARKMFIELFYRFSGLIE
jgi:hypothetical protein